jgi:hypothetical protein
VYGDGTNKTPETGVTMLSLLMQKNKYEEIISIIEANKDKYVFHQGYFTRLGSHTPERCTMGLIFSAWKWNGDNTIHLAQLIDRFEESYGSEMRSSIQFFNDTDATSFDDVINFLKERGEKETRLYSASYQSLGPK